MVANQGFTLNMIVNSSFVNEGLTLMGYQPPKSIATVIQIINSQSDIKKMKIKSQIHDALGQNDKYSICFDEWSLLNKKRYVSLLLTSHSSHPICLGMIEIVGSANSTNILEIIKSKTAEFGLSLKKDIVSLITDGASTMIKIHKESPCLEQICFSHGLHLSVKDSLAKKSDVDIDDADEVHMTNSDSEQDSDCEEAISVALRGKYHSSLIKMKKIISAINSSPLMFEKLSEYRKYDNKKPLSVLNFIEIRWNSIYYAIERFLELAPQIEKVIVDINSKRSLVILYFHFLRFLE